TEEMSGVIPPMIVVGIDNMGFNTRERDMTPTADPKIAHSGRGENFINFMEKELIPYVESNYPVAPYRDYSGHSLAGLAVVSPSYPGCDRVRVNMDVEIVPTRATWYCRDEFTI